MFEQKANQIIFTEIPIFNCIISRRLACVNIAPRGKALHLPVNTAETAAAIVFAPVMICVPGFAAPACGTRNGRAAGRSAELYRFTIERF